VTSDTAELLQWLGEEEEQAVAGSDPLDGDVFGPDLESADAELLEAFSSLVSAELFTGWTD
jgi:hypothetical protein